MDPFKNGDLPERRLRTLDLFRTEPALPAAPAAPPPAGKEVAEVARRARRLLDQIVPHAQKLAIPIDEDENEVRAAARRLFESEGTEITFSQFQSVMDARRDAFNDLFAADFKGYGQGDFRKIDRKRIADELRDFEGKDALAELSSFGSQAMILWALNQLIGAFHSGNHSAVTSGKLPSGTEVGGIVQELVQAFVMMRFLHGLTDDASKEVVRMDSGRAGVISEELVDRAWVQATSSPPPTSRSYRTFQAGMADADRKTVADYSTGYLAKHAADGFDLWWAYLTASDVEKSSLSEYDRQRATSDAGVASRAGDTGERITEAGNGVLDQVVRTLSWSPTVSESCCLVRFLYHVDLGALRLIESVLEMAIAILEAQAAQAYADYLSLMTHPFQVISGEIIRVLDGFFDKIANRVLSVFDGGSETERIIRACLPVSELMDSVLDVLEYTRTWYQRMLRALGGQIRAAAAGAAGGWDVSWQVKKAIRILRTIQEAIRRKENGEEGDEETIRSVVDEAASGTQAIALDDAATTISDVGDLVEDALDICRKLGNWDAVKNELSGSAKD